MHYAGLCMTHDVEKNVILAKPTTNGKPFIHELIHGFPTWKECNSYVCGLIQVKLWQKF